MKDTTDRIASSAATDAIGRFCNDVSEMIRTHADSCGGFKSLDSSLKGALLKPGKMLRSRLAAHISARLEFGNFPLNVCCAVELVHAASLLHDDVVDHASVRRGKPALWKMLSTNSAILFGDLLLTEGLAILTRNGSYAYVHAFIAKVREVCMAEIRQELMLRGRPLNVQQCLEIARGKTGPLFALTAMACAPAGSDFSAALEKAGYCIGAAFQLADDLLDESGDEGVAGKTLGTDRLRSKFTLAQGYSAGRGALIEAIISLCNEARECVAPWPAAAEGIETYLQSDLMPVISMMAGEPLTL
jgi:geranylgeranyl pyrophosphate synthase